MPSPLVNMLRQAADQIERLETSASNAPRNIHCMAFMLEAAENECLRRGIVFGPWWIANHDAPAVGIRRVAAAAAAARGFTISTIARAFGCHHSTVHHLLKPRRPAAEEVRDAG